MTLAFTSRGAFFFVFSSIYFDNFAADPKKVANPPTPRTKSPRMTRMTLRAVCFFFGGSICGWDWAWDCCCDTGAPLSV